MNESPEKPRIAFLNSDLWMGGGAIFVLELSAELSRRGIRCEVFTVRDLNYLAADFKRTGVKVSSAPSAGTIYEDRIRGTLELMRAYNPTLIIAGVEGESGETLRYAPREIPRIGVFHLVLPETLELARLYRPVLDYAVAVSQQVALSLRQSFQDDPLPIQTLELGIHKNEETSRREFPPDRPLRILYLGRLEEPAKRVRRFVGIFNYLKSSGMPFRWNIAGAGPERGYLEEQLVGGASTQEVCFLGPVPHGDVPALLAENDIFLLTSDSESFCLSLHEAMAAGLVPVSSAIPGRVSELVDTATGFSVPADDCTKFGEAILTLHRNRDLLAQMSAESQKRIGTENSIEAMGDRWAAFLDQIHARRGDWPDRWKIGAPLNDPGGILFFPPVRAIRRLVARLRRFLFELSK